ncbi:hypothetical protein GCM10022406_31910 [Hymenobacter algoricola]|uniref:Aspartyl protease n=2 Tax=Hymenobacter algoricola TaxID=486267 RepID=A0ABP7NIB5_9BACT
MKKKFQAPANQLVVSQLPLSSSFVWQADSTARPVVAHRALLVPVRLAGCSRTCYLQFDTGVPYTLLHTKAVELLRAAYPATRAALAAPNDTVRNLTFTLGTGQVLVRRLPLLRGGSQQLPADSAAPFVIGTLGTDLLEGRVLVLDYARQQFRLTRQVPADLAARAAFVPLVFNSRRILFDATVRGKQEQMLFDTGTSAFALLTSQSIWQQLAQPGARPRVTAVNSWGKTLTAHTVATGEALHLGAATVPLQTVTYMEGTSLMQNLLTRFSGMGGMLGNEPFDNRTVILDVQGSRFGLVQ